MFFIKKSLCLKKQLQQQQQQQQQKGDCNLKLSAIFVVCIINQFRCRLDNSNKILPNTAIASV